ncbi:hypothetical protein [Candidatus Enterovibrio escicola]|uniref:hypothetical protein n=1 Tax=Candidatus Enterovibrio escicola TaxID=1927127 RepID=UPI001681A632|nr:hypothetical protein [Candidatus Enterovibrio escacola]
MDQLRIPLKGPSSLDCGISLSDINRLMNDLLSALQEAETSAQYKFKVNNKNDIHLTLVDDAFKLFAIDDLSSYGINQKLADKTLFAVDCGVFSDILSNLSCACVAKDNVIEIRSNLADIFFTLKVRIFSTDADIIKSFFDAVNGYGSCALAFVNDTGNYHDITKQIKQRSKENAIYNVFRLLRTETIDSKFDDVLSKSNVLNIGAGS